METEIQIKTAIKAGNSSAVILPKAWLNKEIRIELARKTPEMMLYDTLGILKENHVQLNSVIGIYLTGSYARAEEDETSDIDILVITNNVDKEMINEGAYNILIVSRQLINQKMANDLLPIGQMIKEAKPLLNSSYLKDTEVKVTKKNVKWYLDTTKDKLKIIQKYLGNKNIKYVDNKIVYTLILRIRTLEIIKRLIKNKDYFKKDFMRLINRISNGKSAYQGYLNIKNNSEDETKVSMKEAERLCDYLKEDLRDLGKRV